MDMKEVDEAWITPPRLVGNRVVVEPMRRGHVPGLQAALAGDQLASCPYTSVPAVAQVQAWVEDALEARASGDAQPFVVVDTNGQVVGSTRYYDMDASVPRLSIGYTWYVPAVQRTAVNSESKLMLLAHAFETLGCVRVAFKTSSLNLASRAAIERLGARQEGLLRSHARHADGSLRDTVVFSILEGEWPAVKKNMQHRLGQRGLIGG